jgi:SAM-dependent methyltransferase
MPRTSSSPDRFDAAYYARHYGGPRRAHGAREVAHLAAGVSHLAAWLGLPLGSVLDVGAGPGLWRDWFRRHRPAVRYRSVDASRYACARYGHERRDIVRWRARARFDLVVCQGVLPYLADAEVERAVENLAAMCRGLLYLEAVTRRDLAEVVDRERTDLAVHARGGAFYRARLDPWFLQVGAGLWAARSSGLTFYELEAAGR